MKTTGIKLFISTLVGGSILSLTPANALILVEPIVNTANPNFPDGPEITFDLLPGQVVSWNAPDSTGLQNFLNGTRFDITRFSLLLLPDLDTISEEVAWGDVNGDGQIGQSNIFSNFTVTPDFVIQGLFAPRLDLTGGVLPNGERFTFQFITSPDLTPSDPGDNGPLLIGGTFAGVPVPIPEPSFVVGYIFLAGLGHWLKKQKST